MLNVSDPQKAKELLESGMKSQSVKIVEGNVYIILHKRADAPQVTKVLEQGGVDLFEMRTTGTMEEVFERTARGELQ
jgi:hypothetical protein